MMRFYRREFWTFFAPLFLLVIFDLLSTYGGVCVLGGYEINGDAVFITKHVGFLGLTLFQFASYAALAYVLSVCYVRAAGREVWRTFILVVWSFTIISMVQLLTMNASSLLTIAGLLPQELLKAPSPDILSKIETFNSSRALFCSLVR